MRVAPSGLIASLALGTAFVTSLFGCEFIASVDRSKIQELTGGAGTTSSSSTSTSTSSNGGSGAEGGGGAGAQGGGGSGAQGGGGGNGGMGGMGGMGGCSTPDDCPGMDTDCAKRTCDMGMCGTMNVAMGTACDDGGGNVCDGMGNCVECLTNAECTLGETCQGNTCVPMQCMNGMKDGQETDVDCGGPTCNKCADNKACMADSDCESDVCTGMVCQTPTCMDGKKNGNESDVDCGGGACNDCADGKTCQGNGDCVSNTCSGGVCACGDGMINFGETDIDCGGPNCPTKCGLGETCGADGDCANANCVNMTCEPCGDGVKNGNETDVDCGGSCATKCADDQACMVAADCTSNLCEAGTCGLNGCDPATATDLTGMANVTINFGGGLGNNYMPKCIKVTAGTNVTFTGDMMANFGLHPLVASKKVGNMLVADPGSPFAHSGAMDTTHTFNAVQEGNHAYACGNHFLSGMVGAVFVVP